MQQATITIMTLFIKEMTSIINSLQLPTPWSSEPGQTAKWHLPCTYHSWQNHICPCSNERVLQLSVGLLHSRSHACYKNGSKGSNIPWKKTTPSCFTVDW